jgi:hypothetical protein
MNSHNDQQQGTGTRNLSGRVMQVKVRKFCYSGPSGGTRLSDGPFDPRYPHPSATVEVERGFFDYETGYRFIGKPADPQITEFRDSNGSTTDQRIFFSEFDLVDRRDLGPLIDRFVGDDNAE